MLTLKCYDYVQTINNSLYSYECYYCISPLFYKYTSLITESGFSNQGQPQAVKRPAVLCHDERENIFTSNQIRTKFYQIQNLILKMDIRDFLDSVVNDRIEKSTNVHWENVENYKGQKENF
jgi:hypothetical protein